MEQPEKAERARSELEKLKLNIQQEGEIKLKKTQLHALDYEDSLNDEPIQKLPSDPKVREWLYLTNEQGTDRNQAKFSANRVRFDSLPRYKYLNSSELPRTSMSIPSAENENLQTSLSGFANSFSQGKIKNSNYTFTNSTAGRSRPEATPSCSAYNAPPLNSSRTNNWQSEFPSGNVFSNSQSSLLDHSTRHLGMAQLKQVPASPYNGDPYLYRSWIVALNHRMSNPQLAPLDAIDVLEAHTTGKPRHVVTTFKATYSHNPDEALKVILRKLETRFGIDTEIACSLRDKLHACEIITGSQSDPNVAGKLCNFSDLCQIVSSYVQNTYDLQTLNYASGLEPIRQKLPEFINNKWRSIKTNYIDMNGIHPPFHVFCEFLEEYCYVFIIFIVLF